MSSGDEAALPKVALVGHPNVGKTTLFNAITGERQKVGNYSGVTVEKVSATVFTPHGNKIELIDLPGAYGLTPNSPDEAVTRDVLLGDLDGEPRPDLVICVLDAASLERHLYLAVQVMDLGLPVIIALNQMDRAEESGARINPQILSDDLDVPVIACQASSGRGVTQLKQALRFPLPPAAERKWKAGSTLEHALADLTKRLGESGLERPGAHALQLLAESEYRTEAQACLSREAQGIGREVAATCIKAGVVPEEVISKERFLRIRRACCAAIHEVGDDDNTLSDKIDDYVLHPVWGWVIFGGLMFLVFWALFWIAQWPMGWIESLVAALGGGVGGVLPAGDFTNLLVDGVIGGVGGVLVFIPQIAILFFFISLLEGSGYMARAAFLMDKVMGKAGLTGKSFLPLLSGYACAIPGVLGTRTINSAKERLLTILILPWISCSARLPVYLILVPLLISGSLVQSAFMFGIYALGTLSALGSAWLLGKRIGRSQAPAGFLLELPPYRVPDFGYVGRQVLDRTLSFLKKAGTVILGLSILLWALSTYPKAPSGEESEQFSHSIMGRIGTTIEPVVAPLGWDGRLGTAVLTSFAAREVFVSSMAISYAIDEEDEEARDNLLRGTLAKATRKDGTRMYTPLVLLSLLIFFIYALQCLPTTAIVHRETKSWKWALGQLAGMTLFAYLAAMLVYQVGGLLGFS